MTLQWRWPERRAAAISMAIGFGLCVLLAYRLAVGRIPTLGPQVGNTEPWESSVLASAIVCCLWTLVPKSNAIPSSLRLWLALTLASFPIIAALPSGESYADVLPGNAVWSMMALLAVGVNALACERIDATGGSNWSLWIPSAQLFAVTALYLTCFASLGENCLLLALSLAAMASFRWLLSSGNWTGELALPATALACTLLTHLRIYSPNAMPAWIAPLAFALPTIVCGVDHFVGRNRSQWIRPIIAAGTAAIVAGALIVHALIR